MANCLERAGLQVTKVRTSGGWAPFDVTGVTVLTYGPRSPTVSSALQSPLPAGFVYFMRSPDDARQVLAVLGRRNPEFRAAAGLRRRGSVLFATYGDRTTLPRCL